MDRLIGSNLGRISRPVSQCKAQIELQVDHIAFAGAEVALNQCFCGRIDTNDQLALKFPGTGLPDAYEVICGPTQLAINMLIACYSAISGQPLYAGPTSRLDMATLVK